MVQALASSVIASRESGDLARRLIRETVEKQGVVEDQLIIHSDRGPSMKSHGVAQLLGALGITKSHSRPHVSNDNPFSESQFKTLKYRPDFPSRFGSQQDAHGFCREFFSWYNDEHYHSGIGLLTPAAVHYGQANEILAKRQAVLDAAYARHPERFVNKAPSPLEQPSAVWINPPAAASATAGADTPPLIEIQTPDGFMGQETELETSSLTSAEASTRPRTPGPTGRSLNSQAHKKRLREIDDLGKPEAPLAHPRLGYPLASCVPAELASVSPSNAEANHLKATQQAPLDTRVMPRKIPGGLGDWSPMEAVDPQPDELKLH